MSQPPATPTPPPGAAPPEAGRTPVAFEHTASFTALLSQLKVSLLVSTYQAGKLMAIGTHDGAFACSFHHVDQPMGVAVSPGRLAVGGRREVWFLRGARDLGPRISPAGRHDACFLTRTAHTTGTIHGHELAWSGDELWVVNTLFSCLCTLHPEYNFVPRWRPPFISALAGEDRCHLNGLAMENGRPRLVTCMAETDTAGGWRPNKATSGCLIDVPSRNVVARGFAMPHSPRLYDDRVWVCDSGKGLLSTVDLKAGRSEPAAYLLGYTRGLSFYGPYAFVGLSKIRETSVFGGVPIAEDRARLKAGVAVVDLRSGREVASLHFHSGVEEIFAVEVLPGVRFPAVVGPNPAADGSETVWLVPDPGHAPPLG